MKNNNRGLSLVELMVVVAIVGIISALAIPKFKLFLITARRAEAKTNLNLIYGLQLSYFGEHDKYGRLQATPSYSTELNCRKQKNVNAGGALSEDFHIMNEIGFSIADCSKARYIYNSNSAELGFFIIWDFGAYNIAEDPANFVSIAISASKNRNLVIPGCSRDLWVTGYNKTIKHIYRGNGSYSYAINDCNYGTTVETTDFSFLNRE